ncbi:hypothetical protein VF21_07646 [Pseudogymnoascus sp. 05NY08]|nr:hypothetical protein VF21_07646 [Pseudogymnoascus sp. 05NY08]
MRLSTYFANAGEVFIFNMGDEFMQQILEGDYVIVYVQSIGGRRPPNEIKPTEERMVRIMPFERNGDTSVSAQQSFIRFNNHFRNIRELVFYPTRKNERVTLDNLKGPSPQDASSDANKSPMTGEAGVRMATGDRSCTSVTDCDVDPSPSAHDDRMEHLFANTQNIRQRGSVISFGMVINDGNDTGYEFCQIEFAAAEGDRVLIVAIKVPDKGNLSSLYLKKQPVNVYMHELVVQRFIGVDKGNFTMKEYGKQDGDETSAPLGPKSHAFYNLDLGDYMEKDLFENYSHEVGRACLEPNQFNAGLFEEWREMIPSQTLDEHMKKIYELYTQEALLAVGQLKTPRMESSDNGSQNLVALTGGNDRVRRKLHIIRDAQMYAMSRRKDLEFERLQEYNFGTKIGPGLPRPRRTTSVRYRPVDSNMEPRPCLPARSHSMAPRPRTPALSHSSGSTTPTNSPVRRAQMAKAAKGKDKLVTGNDKMKEILDRLVLEPSFQRLKTQSKGTTAGEYARLRRKAEENMWNVKIPSLGRNQVSDSGGGGLIRPGRNAGAKSGARADIRPHLLSDSGGGGLVRPNARAGRNASAKSGAGGKDGAKAGARANIIAQAGSKAHFAVEYDVDTETGADRRADAGRVARANTAVAGGNIAANAGAGRNSGAKVAADGTAGARVNIGALAGAKAHADTKADTKADAGGDAGPNTVAGSNAAANTVATVDTGAAVGAGTSAALNAGTDDDSDWSDDDEEGGVRLTPEPVHSEQELPSPATLSKSRTLDGQRDSEPSLLTQGGFLGKRSQRSPSPEEGSPVKRSQNGGGGVSTRTVSPENSSSSNDDGKVESGGGTPDRAPSPKKRKLSDDDDAAAAAGRSNITKLM